MPWLRTSAPRRALVAGLYGALPTGCFYGFALYSSALKSQFDLSQAELDNINTLPYLFGLMSALWGYVGKALGPRLALTLGCCTIASMQIIMYILSRNAPAIPAPPVTLVAVAVVQYFGQQILSGVAFSTPVHHFPARRGLAVAIIKSFVGMGPPVVSNLYILLFGSGGGASNLYSLLFWAGTVLLCAFCAATLLPRSTDPEAAEPSQLLRTVFYHLLVTGLFTILVGLLPDGGGKNSLIPIVLVLVLTPIFLGFAPCLDAPSPLSSAVAVEGEDGGATTGQGSAVLETPFPFDLKQMLVGFSDHLRRWPPGRIEPRRDGGVGGWRPLECAVSRQPLWRGQHARPPHFALSL
jgi:hypothetical protein